MKNGPEKTNNYFFLSNSLLWSKITEWSKENNLSSFFLSFGIESKNIEEISIRCPDVLNWICGIEKTSTSSKNRISTSFSTRLLSRANPFTAGIIRMQTRQFGFLGPNINTQQLVFQAWNSEAYKHWASNVSVCRKRKLNSCSFSTTASHDLLPRVWRRSSRVRTCSVRSSDLWPTFD